MEYTQLATVRDGSTGLPGVVQTSVTHKRWFNLVRTGAGAYNPDCAISFNRAEAERLRDRIDAFLNIDTWEGKLIETEQQAINLAHAIEPHEAEAYVEFLKGFSAR